MQTLALQSYIDQAQARREQGTCSFIDSSRLNAVNFNDSIEAFSKLFFDEVCEELSAWAYATDKEIRLPVGINFPISFPLFRALETVQLSPNSNDWDLLPQNPIVFIVTENALKMDPDGIGFDALKKNIV